MAERFATTGVLPPSPATVRVPVMVPAAEGVTLTERFPVCPTARGIGRVPPDSANCGLENVACVMFRATVPVFRTVTLCVAFLPTVTVPKLIVLAFNWNSPAATVCDVALTTPVHPLIKKIQGPKHKKRSPHRLPDFVRTVSLSTWARAAGPLVITPSDAPLEGMAPKSERLTGGRAKFGTSVYPVQQTITFAVWEY